MERNLVTRAGFATVIKAEGINRYRPYPNKVRLAVSPRRSTDGFFDLVTRQPNRGGTADHAFVPVSGDGRVFLFPRPPLRQGDAKAIGQPNLIFFDGGTKNE